MSNAVSLFTYNFKHLDNFYDREHPTYHPVKQRKEYKSYWKERWQKVIEGRWVDDDGNWIFLPPKAEFFINIMSIVLTEKSKRNAITRKMGKADLRDVTMVFFHYFMCCQGFSGFEEDEDVSCHFLLDKINKGEKLYLFEEEELEETPFLRKDNGEFKKYINPWEYLREYYHTTRVPDRPLGKVMYYNPMKDGILMGSRAGGKTMMDIGANFHEFTTGSVKYWEDRAEIMTNTVAQTIAVSSEDSLKKYLLFMKMIWNDLPGQYRDGDTYHPSPFHRVLNNGKGNPWSAGSKNEIKHTWHDGFTDQGSNSVIYKAIPTVENPQAAVSDRQAIIHCEEFGFVKRAKDFHQANRDSVAADGIKLGINFYWGTSGNLDTIPEPEDLFTNPDVNGFFSIPNYWENPHKRIGLFLGKYYLNDRFRKNGNIALEEAYDFEEQIVSDMKKSGASLKTLTKHRLWAPQKPSHMFRAAVSDILPSEYASDRLTELEMFELFRMKARVGMTEFIKEDGVITGARFVENEKYEPILKLDAEQYDSKKGAVIIYEPPPRILPRPTYRNALYKVVYDPVKKDIGSSLASIKVYKGFTDGIWSDISWTEDLTDSIVAEYVGRDEDDEFNNHRIAIQLAMMYNAKVLYENNERGFYTFCKSNGFIPWMQPTPWLALGVNSNRIEYGLPITPKTKPIGLRYLGDWLKIKRGWKEDTDLVTNTHKLYPERLLREIERYDNDGNYDCVSAMILLAFWLKSEEQQEAEEPTEEGNSRKETFNKIAAHWRNVKYMPESAQLAA